MANSGGLIHSPMNTGKLIHAHYLEIEYLLDRVEGACTHYQVLGVDRSATNEEIVNAYHRIIGALHPSYYKVRAAVPDDILVKIDRAFKKVSQAFSVLTHFKKRVEYDRSLVRNVNSPLPVNVPRPPRKSGPLPFAVPKQPPVKKPHPPQSNVRHATKAAPHEQIDIRTAASQQIAYTKAASARAESNRRRAERLKLSLPVLVAGYDQAKGKWQEVAKTADVSRLGICVRMKRRVQHGAILHISLPMPAKLRCHGYSEPSYTVYAIVRRVEPPSDGLRVAGLEFIGEHPPAGYLYKPWAAFRTQKWAGPDRRRQPRREHSEMIRVVYMNETMHAVREEVAVTENVSASGARIYVKSAPAEFEFLQVTNLKRTLEAMAVVRNRYLGKDGFERLCIQFTDKEWPM
ncbi:MAG TPA: PilZ domain-containing protein [Blastocatellia bacterium]|nr:PilZ domain-containing protein [Blastocatellia bacterium]